jgi:hypothetical protein
MDRREYILLKNVGTFVFATCSSKIIIKNVTCFHTWLTLIKNIERFFSGFSGIFVTLSKLV